MPLYNIILIAQQERTAWAQNIYLARSIQHLYEMGQVWEEWEEGKGAALCGRLDLVALDHKNKTVGLTEVTLGWLGSTAWVLPND